MFNPFFHHINDHRDLFCHDILVLHRVQWEIDTGHCAHFTRPQAPSIYHMFRVDRALVRNHIPCAICTLVGFLNHRMRFNRRATHAGRFCIGMGGARGVQMPIKGIIKPTNDALNIGHRGDLLDLFGAHNFCFKPHKAVLGAFCQ